MTVGLFTGEHINRYFFFNKMYGRSNEVTVLPRWP